MWNKMKKILSFGIIVLLVAAATVSGTLAYQMTADEFAATEGHHIEVQLLRQQTDAEGVYVELTEDPMLFPTANGYTQNILRVKNKGNINTFNRVLIAVPAQLDGAVELIKGDGWTLTKTLLDQDCADEICNIHIFTMTGSLKPETVSEPAVMGVRLDAALEQSGDTYLLNDVTYDFSEGLRLKVVTQAVQSAFFETPAHAFETSGLAENPWQPAAAKEGPVSDTALKAALRSLPTGTDLTTQVTHVVFGYRAQYENITHSCYGRPVDETDPNGPWAYYQATIDADGNTGWTVYILSRDVIYLPVNCENLFEDMSNLVSVDTAACDTRYVTSMHGMFQHCGNLTCVDVSNWDMSNVTSISQMFYQCYKVDGLDVSNWDTSSVTSMSQMFNSCYALTYLDTTNWCMDNVTGGFQYMFSNCSNLTAADVDGWVTKDTDSISFMFLNCKKLETIDVSQWDTSGVRGMDNAFNGCSSVKELDVSNWDTSKVTTTWQMFQNCGKVTNLNLTGWDTSNVKSMGNMFFNCSSLTQLDLSSFNVNKVTGATGMFNGCRRLQTVYVSPNGGWDALSERMTGEVMFASDSKLVGGAGTTHSSQYGEYAKIDGGEEAPGYFTAK